jgi:NAD(P)-dependent dehydrogenase (short-subunit alcohol dehydrogenase family)
MVNSLANQTVVVIGGTSGLGFAVAKHVLESTKAYVVVASSNAQRVDHAISALSHVGRGRVRGYVLDVSDPIRLEAVVKNFYEKVGGLNHLVYTAGDGFSFMQLEQFTRAEAEKIYNIRYWALLECVKQAVPRMPKSSGSSVTFTSATNVHRPIPGWTLTGSGVTGALDSMARGLAVDLAPVRVNCVLPGIVDTELWNWLEESQKAAVFERNGQKLLTKSIGKPDEVAEAYGYLLRCNHVTGQSLTVDGGAALV